jgi:hypothetical protein
MVGAMHTRSSRSNEIENAGVKREANQTSKAKNTTSKKEESGERVKKMSKSNDRPPPRASIRKGINIILFQARPT